MKALLGVWLLHGFYLLVLNDAAHAANQTLNSTNQPVTELFDDPNFRAVENSTSPDSDSLVTVSPVAFSDTTPTNVSSPTNGTSPTEDIQDATTVWTTAAPTTPPASSPPLPPAGSLLVPAPDVSRLCPCDLLLGRCDLNCCCDRDCSAELPLFTHCLVHRVSGNSKLCSQEAAYYSISEGAEGFADVQTSVQQELNPDIFCIHLTNNDAGLSHAVPEVPTAVNFDGLFTQFAEFLFGSERRGGTPSPLDQIPTQPGYQFGDVMRTVGKDGKMGFLRLPAPSVTAHCSDMNPAGFLRDQRSRCVRSLDLEKDCRTLAALNMLTYTDIQTLAGKTEDAAVVAVETASITLQSVEGTQTPLEPGDGRDLAPVLLAGGSESEPALCANVLLQVGYEVRYSEDGEVVNVTAVLTLGAVSAEMLEQHFHITFIQENAEASARYSGNPGYVVGLPLVAGSRTAEGIVQSGDPGGDLTLLYGTAGDDCLRGPHPRRSVLFGVDASSGCTLRLEEAANCSQLAELLLGELRGQAFPQYVASFGNSQPHNPLDWVLIKTNDITTEPQSCSIPLSLHLTVEWTNYGSLVNPQAQILSVKEVIRRNTSDLVVLSGGSGVVGVSSSVTFVPVSAAARPGYRVPPAVDAKLPHGFFFPFV